MNITLVAGDRLTQDHVEAWSELLREDSSLGSPYLRPEFTQAVAAVRDDVEVGILEDGGEAVGFFPFQRTRRNFGKPVGGRLSDWQSVITRKGREWRADELLRGCGLAVWDFTYLPTSQEPFCPYHHVREDCIYMDLSDGFDAYMADNGRSRSSTFKDVRRRARKLERDVGPLRLDLHCTDDRVFETLIDWKRKQYERTGATDVFSFPWTVELLQRIRLQQSEALSGMMTAMYAGDALVAVHLGMRSFGVLNGWFPSYDRQYQKYSPGLILWIELAKAGAADGIQRIDMGKAEEGYKSKLMSGVVPVAEGSVDLRPISRTLRNTYRHTYDWLRSSRLRTPLRLPAAAVYRLREWTAFR